MVLVLTERGTDDVAILYVNDMFHGVSTFTHVYSTLNHFMTWTATSNEYANLPRMNIHGSGVQLLVVGGREVICNHLGVPILFVHVGLVQTCSVHHGHPLPGSQGTSMVKSMTMNVTSYFYARTNANISSILGPRHLLPTWGGNFQFGTIPSGQAQPLNSPSKGMPRTRTVDDSAGGASRSASPSKSATASSSKDSTSFQLKNGGDHGKFASYCFQRLTDF